MRLPALLPAVHRPDADLRYRAVPERYLRFDDFALAAAWDELEIPVGLAFFFRNSVQGRTIAFYPGPAGATESELPLDAGTRSLAANPQLGVLRTRRRGAAGPPGRREGDAGQDRPSCHLVPIDACYELVGRLRSCGAASTAARRRTRRWTRSSRRGRRRRSRIGGRRAEPPAHVADGAVTSMSVRAWTASPSSTSSPSPTPRRRS